MFKPFSVHFMLKIYMLWW